MTKRIDRHLLSLNIQVRSVQHLKAKRIESYIADRLTQEISLRTLNNEMVAVRAILREAGGKHRRDQ